MLDRDEEAEANRAAAFAELLQFIEVPRADFDAQAERLIETVVEARRTKGQHPAVIDRTYRRLRFPGLLGPEAEIKAFLQVGAARYLMVWAVREILRGWRFALLWPDFDGVDLPECGVFLAAEACLQLRDPDL